MASESKGILSLLKDLGYKMKPVLAIDAKATEHILHRQGIGRLKHIDVAYLWMDDEVRSKSLRVPRVSSEENVADLGTKPLSKAVIPKHCLALGYVNTAEENVMCKRQDVAMFLRHGFDPNDRDGWQNSQHAEDSRWPCQGENQQQEQQQQKQQQQADIEQETNDMFVMRYRKVERCFEMFADIIEKKDGTSSSTSSSARSWSVLSMRIQTIRRRTLSWCGSAIRSLVMS